MKTLASLAVMAGLTLASITQAGNAHASVFSFSPNTDFSATPAVVSVGGATFTLTAPGAPITDTTFSVDAVQTGGTGLVNAGGGVVNAYGAGSLIGNDVTPGFFAFPVASGIPYSIADDFIGVSYTAADGVHYGYIEVNGSQLISDGFESTPNTDILTGAVPEPAGIAVLAVGLLGFVAVRRRV